MKLRINKLRLALSWSACALVIWVCGDQPTSVPGTGTLVFEVSFRSGENEHSISNLAKSAIHINELMFRILEADSTIILERKMQREPDGSFLGIFNVPAGQDRIIRLHALLDSTTIASKDTSGVDILPGRSTPINLTLEWASCIERELLIDSGGDQQGYPGSKLPKPIVARVVDEYGKGVRDREVVFSVIKGDASFETQRRSLQVTTNSAGNTEVSLLLGNAIGEILIRVTANDRGGTALKRSPSLVSATLVPPPPPSIDDFAPIFGRARTAVTISGRNFDFPPVAVKFGDIEIPAPLFTVQSNSLIRAIAPVNAQSSPIIVSTAGGTAESAMPFTVARILPEIPIGGNPKGIVLMPDASAIYVADSTNQRIVEVSPAVHKVVGSISLLEFPPPSGIATAIIDNRQTVFVVTDIPSFIIAIDLANGIQKSAVLNQNVTGRQLLISPARGKGYASADVGVVSFSTEDPSTNRFISQGGSPFGLALVRTSQRLFVSNQTTHAISVFDANSDMMTDVIPAGGRPRQMAISEDERLLFVTNRSTNSISIIDIETFHLQDRITVGTHPDGIAISPNDRLAFVVNSGDGMISVIDLSKRQLVGTLSTGSGPRNIALTPDGSRLYVTNFTSRSLSVIRID